MAETVQYLLEQMLPELEDLQAKGIFNEEEIKAVVKRRTHFEYALRRRISRKADFLRYAEYEINLEALRRRRKERLGTSITGTTVSDHAGVRRVHFIFDRGLRKFKGDLRFWLQYIDFAQRSQSTHALGRILANALQFHPLDARLWILAASFEYEHNNNMVAARALMQRALRLNGQSANLWVEYTHLELLYLAKIAERQRVLGITAPIAASSAPTVDVPTLDAEEGLGDSEALAQVRTTAATSKMSAFLAGAIPVAIVTAAMAALPTSLEVRQQLLQLLVTSNGPAAAIEAIYTNLATEFTESPAAVALLAERTLPTDLAELAVADLRKRLDAVLANYDASLGRWPSSAVLEQLVATFERHLSDRTVLPAGHVRALTAAYRRGLTLADRLEDAAVSPPVWVARAVAALEDATTAALLDDAAALLARSLRAHPTAPMLHLLSLRLQQLRGSDEAALLTATQAALKTLKGATTDTTAVHAFRLQLLVARVPSSATLRSHAATAAAANSDDDDDDLDSNGNGRRQLRGGSDGVLDTPLLAVVNAIEVAHKDSHAVGLVQLATDAVVQVADLRGVRTARTFYERLARTHAYPESFWKRCMDLEAAAVPVDVAQMGKLFEARLSVAPADPDIWLAWIRFELGLNHLDRAATLHQRAVRAVPDPLAFMAAYNALV